MAIGAYKDGAAFPNLSQTPPPAIRVILDDCRLMQMTAAAGVLFRDPEIVQKALCICTIGYDIHDAELRAKPCLQWQQRTMSSAHSTEMGAATCDVCSSLSSVSTVSITYSRVRNSNSHDEHGTNSQWGTVLGQMAWELTIITSCWIAACQKCASSEPDSRSTNAPSRGTRSNVDTSMPSCIVDPSQPAP